MPGVTVRFMLGQELKAARVAAGMTQEQLAFAAGVDRSYVSLLEHGKKSRDKVIRIDGLSEVDIRRGLLGTS